MDYARNRQIKYDRVYKTIGKMSWFRIVAGIALLVLVFLMSGVLSESFASRGHFKLAKALMISPAWMEKYKPEEKAYIEAGVLFEDGDYTAACSAFKAIELDAAQSMASYCCIRQSEALLAEGAFLDAYDYFILADASLLEGKALDEYHDTAYALHEQFKVLEGEGFAVLAEYLLSVSQ